MMLKIFDVVPSWLWCCACGVLLVGLSLTSHRLDAERLAHQTTKTDHAIQVAAAESERLALSEQYRAAEQSLQATINQTRKDADAKITTARATADGLRERLRKYTTTSYGLMPPAGGLAGTGQAPGINHSTVVLGTLGAEDVSEAERAEVIRLDLLACYASYDAARAAPITKP